MTLVLPTNIDSIKEIVQRELEATSYACSSLTVLPGGSCNFVFVGVLKESRAGEGPEVAIKHGEEYVALHPDFQISTSRCQYESRCLEAAAKMAPVANAAYLVRAPRLYFFNPLTNTQIQEYIPNSLDLKTYAIRRLARPTDPILEPLCHGIGRGLGEWLLHFHDWASSPDQAPFREEMKERVTMQSLKNTINYGWMVDRIEQFPSILSEAREVFLEVQKMSKRELEDDCNLQVIHGDFWTGNILLPNVPLEDGVQVPLFVIDWEMCQLGVAPMDVAQMITEMYELTLFKGIEAGVWLIQGFMAAYGAKGDEFAFRTLIQVGTHLICFGTTAPNWGTPDQVGEVCRIGRDLVLKAWEKDRAWFERHHPALACLFGSDS